jgi:plasmid stability protein
MKTTVDLPDNLLRQIKLRAVRNGRKLKDMVIELLRKGLAENEPPPSPPVIKEHPLTGLPYIACPPDAPARKMTTADLIAMEQELQTAEDLERLGVSP